MPVNTVRQITNNTQLVYFTDPEGDLNFVSGLKFLEKKHGIKIVGESPEQYLDLSAQDDFQLIFGGDSGDKGNKSIYITQLMANTAKKFPKKTVLIDGNREGNKVRMMYGFQDMTSLKFFQVTLAAEATFANQQPDDAYKSGTQRAEIVERLVSDLGINPWAAYLSWVDLGRQSLLNYLGALYQDKSKLQNYSDAFKKFLRTINAAANVGDAEFSFEEFMGKFTLDVGAAQAIVEFKFECLQWMFTQTMGAPNGIACYYQEACELKSVDPKDLKKESLSLSDKQMILEFVAGHACPAYRAYLAHSQTAAILQNTETSSNILVTHGRPSTESISGMVGYLDAPARPGAGVVAELEAINNVVSKKKAAAMQWQFTADNYPEAGEYAVSTGQLCYLCEPLAGTRQQTVIQTRLNGTTPVTQETVIAFVGGRIRQTLSGHMPVADPTVLTHKTGNLTEVLVDSQNYRRGKHRDAGYVLLQQGNSASLYYLNKAGALTFHRTVPVFDNDNVYFGAGLPAGEQNKLMQNDLENYLAGVFGKFSLSKDESSGILSMERAQFNGHSASKIGRFCAIKGEQMKLWFKNGKSGKELFAVPVDQQYEVTGYDKTNQCYTLELSLGPEHGFARVVTTMSVDMCDFNLSTDNLAKLREGLAGKQEIFDQYAATANARVQELSGAARQKKFEEYLVTSANVEGDPDCSTVYRSRGGPVMFDQSTQVDAEMLAAASSQVPKSASVSNS